MASESRCEKNASADVEFDHVNAAPAKASVAMSMVFVSLTRRRLVAGEEAPLDSWTSRVILWPLACGVLYSPEGPNARPMEFW